MATQQRPNQQNQGQDQSRTDQTRPQTSDPRARNKDDQQARQDRDFYVEAKGTEAEDKMEGEEDEEDDDASSSDQERNEKLHNQRAAGQSSGQHSGQR